MMAHGGGNGGIDDNGHWKMQSFDISIGEM